MEIPLCLSSERKILLEILFVSIDEFYGLCVFGCILEGNFR